VQKNVAVGLANPPACRAASISETTGTSMARTRQPCLCSTVWDYQTPGSKSSRRTSTSSLVEWLMSESEGFLGPGIMPARNVFSGQYCRWVGRLSKVSQMPIDETVCLLRFLHKIGVKSVCRERERQVCLTDWS
jgi:hypothetical protein